MPNALLWTFCAILLAAASARSEDWPQFLGPHRDGSSVETGLIGASPAHPPRVLWKVDCGKGVAQVAVVGDRAYTQKQRKKHEELAALNTDTGAEIWSTVISEKCNDEPSCTPVVDQDRVYGQANRGPLVCLERGTGKTIWSVNLLTEFEARLDFYGTTISPTVDGDLLFTIVGAPAASVVALNKMTGKVVWKQGGDRRGFGSPAVTAIGGKKYVVCRTRDELFCFARDDGAIFWHARLDDWGNGEAASPLAVGNRVFLASYDVCTMFEHAAGAPTVLWRQTGKQSVLATWWSMAVSDTHCLYGFTGSERGEYALNCADAATGKLLWSTTKCDRGNLTIADGKLYIITLTGDLVIASAQPKGYEELNRMKLLGAHDYINAPSIAGKKLFARDSEHIVCVDLKGE